MSGFARLFYAFLYAFHARRARLFQAKAAQHLARAQDCAALAGLAGER